MVDEVIIRRWIKRGEMLINAEALDINDPDHVYNQVKSQGERPEDFGFEHPYAEEFKDKSRNQLIEEIIELRFENTAIHQDYSTHGRP